MGKAYPSILAEAAHLFWNSATLTMDMQRIKSLIALLDASGVAEIEITDSSGGVRLSRTHRGPAPPMPHRPRHCQSSAARRAASTARTPARTPVRPSDSYGHVITAPIVGTFYGFPEPGAKPFVRVGDEVERGQVLCVIDAMKVSHHLQSDRAGRVTWIMARSGDAIELAQPLFVLQYAFGA
jgi:acetyl-CoA carboxylase biotin carboxyl carrier protein